MSFSSQKSILAAALALLVIACGSGSDEDAGQSADSSGGEPKEQASLSGSVSTAEMIASLGNVDADILGVRLGMTPDQAYAALREARPDAQVTKPSYVTMSIKTPVPADTEGAYVEYISINDRMDTVQVRFARPPLENVVVSVERGQMPSSVGPKTSLEVYRDALVEKYGEPAEELVSGNQAMQHFKWLFPSNAKDCYPIEELRSATEWATSVSDLNATPERCASALVYTLSSFDKAIVSRAQGRLGNAGAIALEIQAHVDYQRELNEQSARAAREAATAAPDL